MKKFSKILLISIFTSLIAGSIQSVSADHTLGPNGIFKTADEVNFVTITESEYKLHRYRLDIFNTVRKLFDLENPKHSPVFTEFKTTVKREL